MKKPKQRKLIKRKPYGKDFPILNLYTGSVMYMRDEADRERMRKGCLARFKSLSTALGSVCFADFDVRDHFDFDSLLRRVQRQIKRMNKESKGGLFFGRDSVWDEELTRLIQGWEMRGWMPQSLLESDRKCHEIAAYLLISRVKDYFDRKALFPKIDKNDRALFALFKFKAGFYHDACKWQWETEFVNTFETVPYEPRMGGYSVFLRREKVLFDNGVFYGLKEYDVSIDKWLDLCHEFRLWEGMIAYNWHNDGTVVHSFLFMKEYFKKLDRKEFHRARRGLRES